MVAPSAQAALPEHDQVLAAVPAAQVLQKVDHPLTIVCLVLSADVQPPIRGHRGDQTEVFFARLLLDNGRSTLGCPRTANEGEQIEA